MMNCSDSMKRRAERRDRMKRYFHRLILLALLIGALAGFILGRVSIKAFSSEPTEPVVDQQRATAPEVLGSQTPDIIPEQEPEVEPTPEPEPEPEWVTYRITAYCSCEKCCGEWAKNRPNGIVYGAAGVELVPGVSCASPLPFGTVVEIEGLGTYVVQDRMARWVVEKYGENLIDIYFTDHDSARSFGLKYLNVKVKEVDQNNDSV